MEAEVIVAKSGIHVPDAMRCKILSCDGNISVGSSCKAEYAIARQLSTGDGFEADWIRAEFAVIGKNSSIGSLEADRDIHFLGDVTVNNWLIVSRNGSITPAGKMIVHGLKAGPNNVFVFQNATLVSTAMDKELVDLIRAAKKVPK